jgi:hypothetical protein
MIGYELLNGLLGIALREDKIAGFLITVEYGGEEVSR